MSVLWELVLQHATSYLVPHDDSGSPITKASQFTLDSVRDSLKGSWLSSSCSLPSSTFVTIRELLACRRVSHSHTENAKCLGENSTLHKDHTDHLGLKPISNDKVFLLAWLKTGHSLHCQGESGDQGCVAMTTDDGLYLKDETGSIQCQASFCNWRWLDQALLVPCWNFIPGADVRVRSMVEICPHCTPVVVSSEQSDPVLESSQQSVSVERALEILQRHDSSRHAVNDVQVTGIVINKSPIISVRGNSLFFCRLASDVSGKLSVPILAKEKKELAFLHTALPMYASCSVTHLRPTTMLKGARQSHHVFMCKKETTVTDVKHSCDDRKHRNSITGTVTKCIDASSGIYELDGRFRLYLCYQMDDTAPSTAVLRVGSVITVHNAHHHRKTLPEMTRIVCCMRSTVHVERFSPLDSGPSKRLSPSLSGKVRVLLQHSLTLSELDWLSEVMRHLEKKFSPTYLRKRALHSLLWRLFNTPSTESKKPLLRGKKRNIYEEFLNPSHSCHASREVEKSPPWQFPDLAEVSKLGHDQEDGVEDVDDTGSLGLDDFHFKVMESKNMKPPRILLGYLHLNPATGQVQLRDQTGSVDCIITDTIPHPQTNRHTNKLTETNSCRPPVVTTSNLGRSVERRCSFTCCHMHTWCLGHLIRVEGFLIIREALPLTLAGPSPGSDETCVSGRVCASDRVTEHQSYVVFSMQSVECLNCESAVPATTARVLHGKNGTHNRNKISHSQTANLQTVNLTSDKTSKTDKVPKEPNNVQMVDSPRENFLLLRKSQLINNPEGSLFFYAQILPLEDLPLEDQASETLASCSEGDLRSGVSVMRFSGHSVRWYHTLHCGCAYRVEGQTTKIAKHEFLRGTSLSMRELLLMDCDDTWSVSEDIVVQQFQENLLPPRSVKTLDKARFRFRNLVHVKSVCEVINHKTSSSDGLVSFHGRIISRMESMKDEIYQHNKKRKTSHHQSRTQSSGEQCDSSVKFVVAHHANTSSTVDVHITKSAVENALGLIPGAYVTFRHCRLSRSPVGSVYCCMYPWTTVTVDGIPKDIKSHAVQGDTARSETQSSDLSQSVSSTTPKRFYIAQLLATPDLVSPSQLLIINCHLQTVKYVSLKWSCQRCGHKDCVCSTNSDGQTGELTASARFIVEDGSGEAIVWCNVNSAIASLLGLTENRWSQLELAVRQCQEVIYTYKPEDYNKEVEMPESASDTEGWLSVLCSHRSIQRPLVLHCHIMVWGNSSKNVHAGGTAGPFYPPQARLKCFAVLEGNY